MFINYLYPAHVPGQASLAAHNGTSAAAEFQKLVDHRLLVLLTFVTGALVHLEIGRAYTMAGAARAKAAYQDLFRLWKDADPGIPILKQAKTEYAKLQ